MSARLFIVAFDRFALQSETNTIHADERESFSGKGNSESDNYRGVMMVLTGVRRQDAGRGVRDVTPGKQKIKSHEIFRNTAHQIIFVSSPY